MTEEFKPFDPLEEITGTIPTDIHKVIIRGILDSYHSNYDVLSEALQNAIDAIEEEYKIRTEKKGKPDEDYVPTVWITIDLPSNRIQVCDNGPGIAWNYFKKVLVPGFTAKALLKLSERKRIPRNIRFRGHKGVGLTYLSYGFNYFRIATKTAEEGPICGEIINGRKWVNDDKSEDESGAVERPKLKPSEERIKEFREIPTGTCVTIQCDQDTTPRSLRHISSTFKGWEYILRTKTAIGFIDLNSEENWASRVKIYLRLITNDGMESREIPFRYWYPHENKDIRTLNLNEYFKKHPKKAGVKVSYRKSYDGIYRIWTLSEIQDELLGTSYGSESHSHREILEKYCPTIYAFFVHSAKVWDTLNENIGGHKKYFENGIQIASEYMAIGRKLDIILPYTVSHAERLFILIEFSGARPDFGRKGFTQDLNIFAKEVSESVRKYFIDNTVFLKPTGITPASKPPHVRTFMIDELLEKAKQRQKENPLRWDMLNFLTEPHNEQEVIAIFFEMLGKGIILGYKPLEISVRSTYDCIVKYDLKKDTPRAIYSEENFLGVQHDKFNEDGKILSYPKFMEFKYDLDYLIEELSDPSSNKSFEDIYFVVAWSSGNKWKKTYQLFSCLDPDFVHYRNFHGVTHIMKHPDTGKEINVILLKNIRDMIIDKTRAILKEKNEYSNNQ